MCVATAKDIDFSLRSALLEQLAACPWEGEGGCLQELVLCLCSASVACMSIVLWS